MEEQERNQFLRTDSDKELAVHFLEYVRNVTRLIIVITLLVATRVSNFSPLKSHFESF